MASKDETVEEIVEVEPAEETIETPEQEDVPEGEPFVPVHFNVNTAYGKRGDEGYIPQSLLEPWFNKGIVRRASHSER